MAAQEAMKLAIDELKKGIGDLSSKLGLGVENLIPYGEKQCYVEVMQGVVNGIGYTLSSVVAYGFSNGIFIHAQEIAQGNYGKGNAYYAVAIVGGAVCLLLLYQAVASFIDCVNRYIAVKANPKWAALEKLKEMIE